MAYKFRTGSKAAGLGTDEMCGWRKEKDYLDMIKESER